MPYIKDKIIAQQTMFELVQNKTIAKASLSIML
jgi:hypothetical protein